MTKESLQTWYNSGKIDYSQKEIIKKFGVNDYYPEYALGDLRKLYYLYNILLRNASRWESSLSGTVHQLTFFSAWWNNNLIIVIDNDGGGFYDIKLIVYEMPHEKMREMLDVFWAIPYYGQDLESTKRKAKELEEKLKWGDNPVSYISPKLEVIYYDDYNGPVFPVLYGHLGEKIKRVEVDFNSAKSNPEKYFKPLDIVMICKEKMVHVCIYLGWDKDKSKHKICHALGGNQVMIQDWNDFFIISTNKMLRYHPVIPFKKTDEIIKHIAKCVEGKEAYYSEEKKGGFSIDDNNCENFTNRCVLGLNFSELTERRKRNETPKTELNVVEQLNNTKRDLDNLISYNYIPWSIINKIKDCRRGSGYEDFNVMRDGIKMECSIEVQPKSSIFKDMVKEYIDRKL